MQICGNYFNNLKVKCINTHCFNYFCELQSKKHLIKPYPLWHLPLWGGLGRGTTSFFMKTSITILAFCLIGTLSFAQAPAIQWQKCLGGTGFEDCYSIQPTPDGGYIIAGETTSNDGDVTGIHVGICDAWVIKVSATGAIEWQKVLGGTDYDSALSIQPTTDGGYIMAGYTASTDGDVTGNHGDKDAWVVKLSATGTIMWQKTMGGTLYDYSSFIQPTPDGGYIVAGGTSSYDGDLTGNYGFYDAWVVKLSATGAIEWQKSLGGSGSESSGDILLTSDGGYIVFGTTNSTDGDVTVNHGGDDVWVVKLSSAGVMIWQKTYGGTGADVGCSIKHMPDGGYILAGTTVSNDGDVTGNHGGYCDVWVVKLSASGTIEWQKTLGGTDIDTAQHIQPTPDGGYIVACDTYSNDGDVTGYHGDSDAWVVKLSAIGTIIWQKALGGSITDQVRCIQPTPDGGYIMAGITMSTDGDVIGNIGVTDVWVVKLEPELMATTSFASQELKIFPNPAKNILQLQTTTNGSLDKITITDLTGKIFLTQTTNTAQINVEPLASGMYILEATSGENKFSSKFVKE